MNEQAIITIAFDDLDEAEYAYREIERVLAELGQIGTLSMARSLHSALSARTGTAETTSA